MAITASAEPSAETAGRAAAPALRPWVDGYVGYRIVGFPPGLHRGLPSRHLTFIVSLGEVIDVVRQTDPRDAPRRYGFVVGGLQTTTALIAHHGNQEGIAVELTPLGSRALLGLPAGALWNTSIEADEVMGRVALELQERLHDVTGWEARFEVCDAVLTRLLRPDVRVPAELRRAWELVVGSAGTVAIADVADEVGWSRRHLAHRFRTEFGLSPKAAARVVRFERACRLLRAPTPPPLAELAAVCGYYDQPHLNRDFAELAGCSPLEWLASDLPSVQDPDGGDAARCGA